MGISIIIACVIIVGTANAAVIMEEAQTTPETSLMNLSKDQTDTITFLEAKPESEIEWKIQLPGNASAKEQQKLFNKLMPFLAKQFDSLRDKKRLDQQYHSNSYNDKKPDEKNDRPFSLEDVEEYFKVGEVQISPEDNMATFKITVTDKIFSELDKNNVRDTIWYQKAIEQRNSEWKSGFGKSRGVRCTDKA